MNTIEIENNNSCNCVGECTCTKEFETSRDEYRYNFDPIFFDEQRDFKNLDEDTLVYQFIDSLSDVYPTDGSRLMLSKYENGNPNFKNKIKRIDPIQYIIDLSPKTLVSIFTNELITNHIKRLKIYQDVFSELEIVGGFRGSYYVYAQFKLTQLVLNEVMKTFGYRGEFGDDIEALIDGEFKISSTGSLEPHLL